MLPPRRLELQLPPDNDWAMCHATGPLLLSLVRSGDGANDTRCWAAPLEMLNMDVEHPPTFGSHAFNAGLAAPDGSCVLEGGDAASCPALDAAAAAAAVLSDRAPAAALYVMWFPPPAPAALAAHTVTLLFTVLPLLPLYSIRSLIQAAAFFFTLPSLNLSVLAPVVLLLYCIIFDPAACS